MSAALLLDLYELTMAAGYQQEGLLDQPAIFDLSFRRAPFGSGFAVYAGLEPALRRLETLRFDDADRRYLGSLGLFGPRFLDWLEAFRFTGRVTSVAEGDVVFGGEPLLTVEASLGEAQIVETALLNIISFQTLIATKAARVTAAAEAGEGTGLRVEAPVGGAGTGLVVEFGARRAHGPDGALGASRAAFIGGARLTSHLAAGRDFGIPVSGTQAHSWVMAFDDELEAFRAYARAFPDACVLLLDTYDTLRSGLPNAIQAAREMRAAGHELRGVRIDSGDLAWLSKEVRRALDDAGFPDVAIVASNELDEHIIESVRKEGGRVDVYGVGTQLTTGGGPGGGSLGGIYKLVQFRGEPRIKISSDPAKSTLPGAKRLWRVENPRDGLFAMDIISRADETPAPREVVLDPVNPWRTTIVPDGCAIRDARAVVMEKGKRAAAAEPLEETAARARERLSRLPEGCRRLLNPHIYHVSLTRGLHALRDRLIERAAPGAGSAT
jgi:nicotinate phosphoribosyltransferase